jgi:hypothetical protein
MRQTGETSRGDNYLTLCSIEFFGDMKIAAAKSD